MTWAVVGAACLWVSAFTLAQARAVATSPPPQSATPGAPSKDQLDFFESRIRPIFAANCYQCHSGSLNPPKGEPSELDWQGGVGKKGGDSGPAIVPGDPEKSLLIQAVRYADPTLHMPPSGKLSDAEISDLVAWVRMGAPDPRTTWPAPGRYDSTGVRLRRSRQGSLGLQAGHEALLPVVKNTAWVKNDIDRFVEAKLEASGMTLATETG